jgi:cell shape-determining protein MreC
METITVDTSLLVAAVGLLAAPIAALATYFTTRPKQKSDVHSNVVNSAGAAVDAIADVLTEVRKELEEARLEIEALRNENRDLHLIVKELRMEIQQLRVLTKEVEDAVHPDISPERPQH